MFKTKQELLEWALKEETYKNYSKSCTFLFTKGEGCSCSDCIIRTLLEYIRKN